MHDADSAETALSMLSGLPEPPALIVSDLRLGSGAGGAELLRTAVKSYPDLKGILMSGARAETLASDSYPFLAKPFNPEDLIGLVATVLADKARTDRNVPS